MPKYLDSSIILFVLNNLIKNRLIAKSKE